MEKATANQLVEYHPYSPSVLFHRLRSRALGQWQHSKMVKAVRKWLKPPAKQATALPALRPQSLPGKIIIPDADDPFMILAKSDPMSSLLAENQRLRSLIDELVREDRRAGSAHIR